MVKINYTPEESLKEIKLRMIYDSSKTLNENVNVIKEQADLGYFETAVKSIMNKPAQVQNLNFGSSTINVKQAATALKDAVTGLGTDRYGINYVIEKGFNNIANSMAIIKMYPAIAGESLYDALNGEWFDGGTMTKMINVVKGQLVDWCSKNPNISLCKVKTADELKYGKI
jgi:hypothetical protein